MHGVKTWINSSDEANRRYISHKDFSNHADEIRDAIQKYENIATASHHRAKPSLDELVLVDALFVTVSEAVSEANRILEQMKKRRR